MLIIIVLISGCATLPFPSPSKDTVKEVSPDQPGRLTNRGVTLNFIEGKPPQDRIYLGYKFRVKVLLQNWGFEEVSGIVSLSDKLSGKLEAIPSDRIMSFTIPGMDPELKPLRSTEDILDFGEFEYTDKSVTDTVIRAEVEYDYITYLRTQICIKSELARASEQECTIKRTFNSADLGPAAQYAPVTVTSIKQDTNAVGSQANVILILTFQDFGGSDGWINNEDNSINIEDAIHLAGIGPFKCNPKILKFTDRRKTWEVRCELTVSLPQNNYFQNPLTIILKYPYKIIVATNQIPVKSLESYAGEF